MPGLNVARTRELLQRFDFRKLFIEELGWGAHKARLDVALPGASYALDAVAEKCGLVVYHLVAQPDAKVPDSATRRKIERQVTHCTRENIIIFTDAAKTTQDWRWVRRQPG